MYRTILYLVVTIVVKAINLIAMISPSSSRYYILVVDTNTLSQQRDTNSHNNDKLSGVKPQSGMLDSFCKKNDNSLTLQELKNIEKERRALLLRVSSCMYCSAQLFVHITYC